MNTHKVLALGLLVAIVVLAAFASNASPQTSVDMEDDLGSLISTQERLTAEAVALRGEREAREAEAALLVKRLQDMLPRLWAMAMDLKGAQNASGWDKADRRKVWLDAACGQARARIESLLWTRGEYARIRARELEIEAQARLVAVKIAAAKLKLGPLY